MKKLSSIPLDHDWQYSIGGSVWHDLPALTDWPPPASMDGSLHLRHSVYLSPTDFCVRYLLVLESAPAATDVLVNGWQVGTTRGDSFCANVTDQVALEENVMLLKVTQAGAFGHVYLQAVPCE